MGALLQSGAGSGLPSGTRVGELVGFVASLYPAPLASPAVLVGLAAGTSVAQPAMVSTTLLL